MKEYIIFSIVAIGSLAIVALMSYLDFMQEIESWIYNDDPVMEGNYIIKMDSGEKLEAVWKGGSWYKLTGEHVNNNDVSCWIFKV